MQTISYKFFHIYLEMFILFKNYINFENTVVSCKKL